MSDNRFLHRLSQPGSRHAFQPSCWVFIAIRGGLPDIDNDLREAFPAHFDLSLVHYVLDLYRVFLLTDHLLRELELEFLKLPLLHDVVEGRHVINHQEYVKAQQVGEGPGFQGVHDD